MSVGMFDLRSPAFADHGAIPTRFTAEGEDVSPPLVWSGVPEHTKSLALIVEDPDAPDPTHPRMTWVHWVVVDLPPELEGLEENASLHAMPVGCREGRNDWGRIGYGGPSPPIGRHRYVHRLFALDGSLAHLAHPTRADVLRAIQGHQLAEAVLVGTYQRRHAA